MFELPRVEKLFNLLHESHTFEISEVSEDNYSSIFSEDNYSSIFFRVIIECQFCSLDIIMFFTNDIISDSVYYWNGRDYLILTIPDKILNCDEQCCKDIIE